MNLFLGFGPSGRGWYEITCEFEPITGKGREVERAEVLCDDLATEIQRLRDRLKDQEATIERLGEANKAQGTTIQLHVGKVRALRADLAETESKLIAERKRSYEQEEIVNAQKKILAGFSRDLHDLTVEREALLEEGVTLGELLGGLRNGVRRTLSRCETHRRQSDRLAKDCTSAGTRGFNRGVAETMGLAHRWLSQVLEGEPPGDLLGRDVPAASDACTPTVDA